MSRFRIIDRGEEQLFGRYEIQRQFLGLWFEAGDDYWMARFDTTGEAEQVLRSWSNKPSVVMEVEL